MNHQLFKWTSLFLAVLIVTLLLCSGQPTFVNAAVIFSDDFEDGNYTGWSTSSGSWSVVTDGSRVLKQSSTSANCYAYTGSSNWTSYSVEARVKVLAYNGSNRMVGLCARFQDTNNFYFLRFSNSNILEIRKKVNGSTTTLASKSYTCSAGKWYSLKLTVNGNTLTAYVNGVQQLTATDSTFSSGRIGVTAVSTSVEFDDFIVDNLNGSTTPTPTPTITPTPTPTTTPTPTPTPSQGVSTIYQAENATIYHGVVANNHSGYTGTGFVDYTNETGSYVEWTVYMAQLGNQTLTFRYANGTSTNRSTDIYVNGSKVVSNLAFNGTGAWTSWHTQTATVYLNSGSNTIRATANTSNGGPNIDYLQVSGAAGQPTPTQVPTPTPTSSFVPVFPGAVGYGIDTPAGRGGRIIKVTNLNSEGPGSFREALAASGPRIIIFEVGGIIDLNKSGLRITEPFVTIAGQTAPSPGITIIRGGMEIRTHDVLMKHIRFRIGDAGATGGFEPDVSTYGSSAYNIVIDHCSFTWGVDENLSISGPRYNGPNGTSRRITLSNNIIAEGLYDSIHSKGIHSMGTLVHDYCSEIAIIGNLYAHNNERNPWYKGYATGVIVNNVIYNPGKWPIRLGYVTGEWDGYWTPEPPRVSIVGNYMKLGINSNCQGLVGSNSVGEAYLEDNIALDRSGKSLPLTYGGVVTLSNRPVWPEGLVPLPASQIVNQVVNHSGARPRNRDSVDQRIISQFLNNTGQFVNSQNEVGGYPTGQMTTRTLVVPNNNIDEWLHSFSLELE